MSSEYHESWKFGTDKNYYPDLKPLLEAKALEAEWLAARAKAINTIFGNEELMNIPALVDFVRTFN